MTTIATFALVLPFAHAVLDGATGWPVRMRKVGGIRFLRIGKLQFSFCVCRKSI